MDEVERERALRGVDTLARKLVDRAAPVRFGLATTPAELKAIWQLRARVVVERGWAPATAFPDGMEHDHYDDHAVLIAGWASDTIAATGRIVYPAAGERLPTEAAFDLVAEPAGRLANVDRMVVAKAYSDATHRVFMGLAGACWLKQREAGYALTLGTETPAMIRLYRRIGWTVTPLGPARPYWGEERFPCRFDPLAGISLPAPTDAPVARATDTILQGTVVPR